MHHQQQHGVMKRSNCFHLEVHYFPITARPEAFYASQSMAVSPDHSYLFNFFFETKHFVLACLFIVTFNAAEHQQNKFTCTIAAINSCSFLPGSFLPFFFFKLNTKIQFSCSGPVSVLVLSMICYLVVFIVFTCYMLEADSISYPL